MLINVIFVKLSINKFVEGSGVGASELVPQPGLTHMGSPPLFSHLPRVDVKLYQYRQRQFTFQYITVKGVAYFPSVILSLVPAPSPLRGTGVYIVRVLCF